MGGFLKKIIVASTDLQTGVTTTARATIPDIILELDIDQRNLEASQILVDKNPNLKVAENIISQNIEKILDEKQNPVIIQNSGVINIFSNSGSDNVINYGADPQKVFKEAKEIIEAHIQNGEKRAQLIKSIDLLEKTKGTTEFSKTYTDFINLAASHMALFGPILPALTQWLAG